MMSLSANMAAKMLAVEAAEETDAAVAETDVAEAVVVIDVAAVEMETDSEIAFETVAAMAAAEEMAETDAADLVATEEVEATATVVVAIEENDK